MKKQSHRLSKRERLFCVYYVNSMDAVLSSINAGYKKDPYQKAMLLLSKQNVSDEIVRLINIKKNAVASSAILGYQKLAFSPISDAVSLLFMENPDEKQLMNMNLFMVSEIKKLKDGAMEIKFFDRLKSLEKLVSLQQTDTNDVNGLINALCLGAENIADGVGEGNEL